MSNEWFPNHPCCVLMNGVFVLQSMCLTVAPTEGPFCSEVSCLEAQIPNTGSVTTHSRFDDWLTGHLDLGLFVHVPPLCVLPQATVWLCFAPQYFDVRAYVDISTAPSQMLGMNIFFFFKIKGVFSPFMPSFGVIFWLYLSFYTFSCCFKNPNTFSMCKTCCYRELIFIITVIKNIWCYDYVNLSY